MTLADCGLANSKASFIGTRWKGASGNTRARLTKNEVDYILASVCSLSSCVMMGSQLSSAPKIGASLPSESSYRK